MRKSIKRIYQFTELSNIKFVNLTKLVLNYFKFIKHNKNVVFRKILINIKIPDILLSGIFIFILCCSRSKEFRRQGFKANPVCHFIYGLQARQNKHF